MQVRPFRLPGARTRSAVEAALLLQAAAWMNEWFAHPKKTHVAIEPDPCALMGECWLYEGIDDEGWVALRLRDGLRREFATELFGASDIGGEQPSVLASSVMEQSLGAFRSRLLAAAGVVGAMCRSEAGVTDLRTGRGSGALSATVSIGDVWIDICVSGGVVAKLTATAEPLDIKPLALKPREACIARGRIAVAVKVGEAELTVGELSQLLVGDVIRLDALHKNPLSVLTQEGALVGRAHLGLRDNSKAVQMAALITDRKEQKHV